MTFAKLDRRALLAPLAVAAAMALPAVTAQAQSPGEPPCPPGARCGSIAVPLDRSNPAAGTTDIGYVLMSHTDTTQPSLGTIVPNPGGPGNATTSFAPYTAAFAPLLDRRDLLLVDARGTGRSEALSCPTLAAM